MDKQTKVAGVILAGGLARRMDNQDKGLVDFRGQPLVSYAVAAMSAALEGRVFISANRHLEQYRQFGCEVIRDQTDSFDGPLAGVLAAMQCADDAELLVVMPCDSPLVEARHLQKLLSACLDGDAQVAVAFDGERLHPVFMVVRTSLMFSLSAYLALGHRKLQDWLAMHSPILVDFSGEPKIFTNINSFAELRLFDEKG